MKIDLHIHSNYSGDGEFSAKEIIDMAIQKDIKVLAIADHDDIRVLKEANEYAKDKDILYINASECFCEHNGKLFHMLTYGINDGKTPLSDMIKKVWKTRNDSVEEQFKILDKIGLYYNRDEVFEYGGDEPLSSAFAYSILKDERNQWYDELKGRSANTLDIVAICRSLFAINKPLYAKVYIPTVKELVDITKESGGICVLAHPGYDLKDEELYMLDEIIAKGVKGVEAYYYTYTKEQEKYYVDYAKANGILYTVGSDFHGKFKPEVEMGVTQSSENEKVVSDLLSEIKKNAKHIAK